jgi:lipoprotein-releasing system ATP-binding protein
MLRVENLAKSYATGRGTLELFRDLNLSLRAGDLAAIVGESGAGKSTLLHILATLDTPTTGEVTCDGVKLSSLSANQAADFRNRTIGYVWQFHYLLPEFTAAENIAMPLLARGVAHTTALAEAKKWLAEVELADRANHRSGELSGGEQQRVSLARALITQPKILLADEPTGDLDGRTADVVFALLERLHAAHGLTSVLVTHNLGFARHCQRAFRLQGGQLTETSPQSL